MNNTMIQKVLGIVLIALAVLVTVLTKDITVAIFLAPIVIEMMFSKETVIYE